jgi:ABC-2 type transport system ATP-binding protein
VQEVMKKTGVADVQKRVIGQLSKGYRQRVGLADALLHEPDLLILDEPTIGLDPVQIRQVRELIKELGRQHTILLSTHILPEVEMTCNRVIILHRGKILASDTPENLRRRMHAGGMVNVELRAPLAEAQTALQAVTGVASVSVTAGEDGLLRASVEPTENADPREAIYEAVSRNGWKLRELTRSHTTLEDIFVQVTREEDEAEEDRRDQRRSVLR